MDLTRFADEYWRQKDDRVDQERLSQLLAFVPKGARVLVVDGGPGMLAERLEKAGFQVEMTDLSAHAVARARAKGLKATAVDTDDAPLPYDASAFDCVLSDSAIEHRYYPMKAISECIRTLKPGGTFILLIPNIAHWRQRLWLLFGRFPEVQDGPTDRCHLRFFAKPEICSVLREHGLVIKKVTGSASVWVKVLYPRLFRIGIVGKIYAPVARLWPSLFARDLIFVATKASEVFRSEKDV